MKRIAFSINLIIAVTVSSCTPVDADIKNFNTTNCDFHTFINTDWFENDPNDPLVINNLEINENCLEVTFSASGCDGSTWEIKLIDSQQIIETNPPQRNLRLSLKNLEVCTAVPTRAISFDISNLQIPDENGVYLNIINSNQKILYEY